jgi:hypothetical protein
VTDVKDRSVEAGDNDRVGEADQALATTSGSPFRPSQTTKNNPARRGRATVTFREVHTARIRPSERRGPTSTTRTAPQREQARLWLLRGPRLRPPRTPGSPRLTGVLPERRPSRWAALRQFFAGCHDACGEFLAGREDHAESAVALRRPPRKAIQLAVGPAHWAVT